MKDLNTRTGDSIIHGSDADQAKAATIDTSDKRVTALREKKMWHENKNNWAMNALGGCNDSIPILLVLSTENTPQRLYATSSPAVKSCRRQVRAIM